MGSFVKHLLLTLGPSSTTTSTSTGTAPTATKTAPPTSEAPTRRTALVTSAGLLLTITSASASASLLTARPACAAVNDNGMTTGDLKWGTRSFIMEKYFSPGLTPEEAAARIRHTAEGMRTLREMLERMAWKYSLFYVRQKSSYLDMDLKNAMAIVPQARRKDYIRAANQVVDDMTELDRFIRTPKVYESYLYYEKALKSLDEVIAFFV